MGSGSGSVQVVLSVAVVVVSRFVAGGVASKCQCEEKLTGHLVRRRNALKELRIPYIDGVQ